jgi:endonuclease YncB( thermonuclease family)
MFSSQVFRSLVIMRRDQSGKSKFSPTGALRASVCATAWAIFSPGAQAVECQADPTPAGSIIRVTDGRTIVLADGRAVRLAAIEVPPMPQGAAAAPASGAARASTDALARLVAGNDIAISVLGTDRHGRVLARAYLKASGTWRPIEVELIGAGQAFVSPYAAPQKCTNELKAAERRARAGRLGLWADPYYAATDADNTERLLAAQGRFAVVEGKVASVRESSGTIYVNFGRRWSEDFTVTIAKRNERLFAESGFALKSLAGRRVRVRGTIEARGGPWIEAVAAGQIELADR